MKDVIRIILLLFAFGCMYLYSVKKDGIIQAERKNELKNGVEFEGVVVDFVTSHNHCFGILFVRITKNNSNDFNLKFKKVVFPYRIEGNIAEIYCDVNDNRKKGEMIKVNSNLSTIYYLSSNDNEVGDLCIIRDYFDIDFIKEYTRFKN